MAEAQLASAADLARDIEEGLASATTATERAALVPEELIRAIDAKATPAILADICRDCSWFPISACCRNICSGRYVK